MTTGLPVFFLNFLLILIYLFFVVIFQTSFHPFSGISFLNWIPTPLNWLPVFAFFSLYRKPGEGIISCYLAAFSLFSLTVSSPGPLLIAALFIFILCQLVKSRVYWNGPGYFCLLCLFSTFTFQIIHFFINAIFLDHFVWPNVLLWIPQALLTLIPAYISFFVLNFIDHISKKEPLTEVTGNTLA